MKSNVRRFGSGLGTGVVDRVRQASLDSEWVWYRGVAEAV